MLIFFIIHFTVAQRHADVLIIRCIKLTLSNIIFYTEVDALDIIFVYNIIALSPLENEIKDKFTFYIIHLVQELLFSACMELVGNLFSLSLYIQNKLLRKKRGLILRDRMMYYVEKARQAEYFQGKPLCIFII